MRRIIACDGGGCRGVLIACALIELERQTGKLTRELFDMVGGTSTGALIAAAVAAGIPATQILAIYRDRGKEIINHGEVVSDAEMVERGWKYDSANIYRVLKSELGAAADWALNDSPIRLLIPAIGANGHRWYFTQDRPKNKKQTGRLSLLDCAVASASAPTYFKPWYVNPPKDGSGVSMDRIPGWCFDGGIGVAACPVYQGCLEAFKYDDFDPADTQVISLGTGYYPNPKGDANPPDGLVPTIQLTVDCLLDSISHEQVEAAKLKWPGVVERFNWLLPRPIDMADVNSVPELIELGQKTAKDVWQKIPLK